MYINLSTEQLKHRLSFKPEDANYDPHKYNNIFNGITDWEQYIKITDLSKEGEERKVEQYDIYQNDEHKPNIFNQPVRVISPYGSTYITYTSGGLFAYKDASKNKCGAMAIYLLYNFYLEQVKNKIIYSQKYNTIKIWSLLSKETRRFCDEYEVYPIVYQRMRRDAHAPPGSPNQNYLIGTIKTDGTFLKEYAALHYHPKRSVILECIGTPKIQQEADDIDGLLPGIITNIIQHG